MTFYQNVGLTKNLYFCGQKLFLLIKWVHNDSMYVRFAGMRNTKTWSKSIEYHVQSFGLKYFDDLCTEGTDCGTCIRYLGY